MCNFYNFYKRFVPFYRKLVYVPTHGRKKFVSLVWVDLGGADLLNLYGKIEEKFSILCGTRMERNYNNIEKLTSPLRKMEWSRDLVLS